MGINSHIRTGDLLCANDGAQVYTIHPDEIHPTSKSVNLWEDDDRLVCNLEENDVCLVLAVAPAGSAGLGNVFFVMTQPRIRFGWLYNHVVRGFVTQREPLHATTYDSWRHAVGGSST